MKKLFAAAASLWAVALTTMPAPAEAVFARYPSNLSYFSCGIFQSSAVFSCTNGDEPFSFIGYHKVAVGSSCGGGCVGTSTLRVEFNIGPGRKNKVYFISACGGEYVFDVAQCSSCA